MAVGSVSPFQPVATVTVAATASAQTAAVTPADSILVYNAAAVAAFVQLGGGVASVLKSSAIAPGGRQLFAAGPLVNSASVILASGTGNVYLTSGNGTAY